MIIIKALNFQPLSFIDEETETHARKGKWFIQDHIASGVPRTEVPCLLVYLYLPVGLKQEGERGESKARCLEIWTSHLGLEHS